MDNTKNLYHMIPGRENADLEFEQNVMNNPEAFNQYKNDINTYIDNEVQRINNGYIPRYVHRQDYRYDFIFNNPNVHSIVYNGIQYWLAKDVARELGYEAEDRMYQNTSSNNIIILTSKEVATNLVATSFESLGLSKHTPKAAFINEQGIYDCLDHSRVSPKAEEFRKWSNSEVRPSIRQTGGYIDNNLQQQLMSDPSYVRTIIAQNAQIKAENEALNAINKANSKYIDFAKAAIADGTCVSVNIFCKIMQNSLPFKFGEYMVFENLRCDGFLCRDKQNYNMPTAKAIQMELFKLAYDIDSHSYNLMVTPTGISYLIAFYKNKFNIQRNIN